MHDCFYNLDLNQICPLLTAYNVMLEMISYYNANGSNVYALMLDTNKAFDKFNYVKTLVSPLVVRHLLCICILNKNVKLDWAQVYHPILLHVTESNRAQSCL